MPDFENLKKQAKLILHWHRDQYYPVAAQIKGLLPRFRDMPDSEILAASFKLSDAQEMVARQHGFSSWQALKLGISATPRCVKSPVSKATIVAAEPQLFVTDLTRSCEFFVEKLKIRMPGPDCVKEQNVALEPNDGYVVETTTESGDIGAVERRVSSAGDKIRAKDQ